MLLNYDNYDKANHEKQTLEVFRILGFRALGLACLVFRVLGFRVFGFEGVVFLALGSRCRDFGVQVLQFRALGFRALERYLHARAREGLRRISGYLDPPK